MHPRGSGRRGSPAACRRLADRRRPAARPWAPNATHVTAPVTSPRPATRRAAAHVHPVAAQRRRPRPAAGRSASTSWPGGSRPAEVTTRCQGTPPPCRAMIVPTSRAEPGRTARRVRRRSRRTTSPGPAGSARPAASTASTYSSRSSRTRHDMGTASRAVRDRDRAEWAACATQVTAARRIVVKVGSSSLTTAAGGLDRGAGRRAGRRARRARRRRPRGRAGLLRRDRRRAGPARADPAPARPGHPAGRGQRRAGPADRPVRGSFARHGRTVGQVLLTVDDVTRRAHYRNAYRTLRKLLDLRRRADRQRERHGRHRGDPVRRQRPAGRAGRRAGPRRPAGAALRRGRALHRRPDPARLHAGSPRCATRRDLAGVDIGGAGRAGVGTGGMVTKVEAARIATGFGIPVVLTAAPLAAAALAGEPVGTLFHPVRAAARPPGCSGSPTPPRRAAGCTSTPGAVQAVVGRRKSLLPAGITAVDGAFTAGDPVDLVDADGRAGRPRAGQLRRGGAARAARPLHRRPRRGARPGVRTRGRPPRRPGAAV